jgi:hypothetical protein
MAASKFADILARLAALECATFGHARRRLTKKQLAEIEDCSTRSIDRGVARGVYAPPEIENKRCYWWSDTYRRAGGAVDTPALRAARNPALRTRDNPDSPAARAKRNPQLRRPAQPSPQT